MICLALSLFCSKFRKRRFDLDFDVAWIEAGLILIDWKLRIDFVLVVKQLDASPSSAVHVAGAYWSCLWTVTVGLECVMPCSPHTWLRLQSNRTANSWPIPNSVPFPSKNLSGDAKLPRRRRWLIANPL